MASDSVSGHVCHVGCGCGQPRGDLLEDARGAADVHLRSQAAVRSERRRRLGVGILGTAALCLVLGFAGTAGAQEQGEPPEQPEQPEQPEEPPDVELEMVGFLDEYGVPLAFVVSLACGATVAGAVFDG